MIRHLETIKGRGPRKYMQDFGKWGKVPRNNASWLIVCDGIGGQPGGLEAAKICANTLHHYLKNCFLSGMSQKGEWLLKSGLLRVAEQMKLHIMANMSHLMMGTTVCGLLECNDELVGFWSGDSRIFQFRNNKCIWRSIPHTPVFDDYRIGKRKLSSAEQSTTNILTKHIEGSTCFPSIEAVTLNTLIGDQFILCTDGFWNCISVKKMEQQTDRAFNLKAFDKDLKMTSTDNFFAFSAVSE